MGPRLRTTFLLGVLAGLVIALARVIGRSQSSPAPSALSAPSRTLPLATPTTPATATASTTRREPTAPPGSATVTVDVGTAAAPSVETAWRPAVDGACPDGYPIKAKESSRIFHQPGGLSYERTQPDRCYPDPASAEADGFRAAKR